MVCVYVGKLFEKYSDSYEYRVLDPKTYRQVSNAYLFYVNLKLFCNCYLRRYEYHRMETHRLSRVQISRIPAMHLMLWFLRKSRWLMVKCMNKFVFPWSKSLCQKRWNYSRKSLQQNFVLIFHILRCLFQNYIIFILPSTIYFNIFYIPPKRI